MIDTKICSQCHEAKPLSAFARDCTQPSGYRAGCKACKNGARFVSHDRNESRWTDAEDGIIAAFYPDGGDDACIILLDRRSRGAIRQRAMRLKIKCANPAGINAGQGEWALRDSAPAHRAWQAIDRDISATPAANGPTYSMGLAA